MILTARVQTKFFSTSLHNKHLVHNCPQNIILVRFGHFNFEICLEKCLKSAIKVHRRGSENFRKSFSTLCGKNRQKMPPTSPVTQIKESLRGTKFYEGRWRSQNEEGSVENPKRKYSPTDIFVLIYPCIEREQKAPNLKRYECRLTSTILEPSPMGPLESKLQVISFHFYYEFFKVTLTIALMKNLLLRKIPVLMWAIVLNEILRKQKILRVQF